MPKVVVLGITPRSTLKSKALVEAKEPKHTKLVLSETPSEIRSRIRVDLLSISSSSS
jgi:hypothetical protein